MLLATLDDDDYRRLASYLVERATGRTLVVDGRFAVHLSLRPALVMSKARITNPPWASGPNLAEIGHMEVQVALWPLLSGTLLIERLILEYATFALERSADGRGELDDRGRRSRPRAGPGPRHGEAAQRRLALPR